MQWQLTLLGVAFSAFMACSSAPTSKAVDASGGSGEGGEGGKANSARGGEANEGGDGGSSGQAAATDYTGPLGRRCDASRSCETGLDCFLASGTEFEALGPAGGLCSVRCITDEDCLDYVDSSIEDMPRCVALVQSSVESAICMPGCRLGDDSACGGRDEVACWALEDSPSDGTRRVCLPLCNHDEQCPPGTVCDGESNLCSSWVSTGGLAMGEECDITANNSCTNGFCTDFGTGGVCTAYCRRGTFPQCGGNGDDATCGWVFEGDEKAGLADTGMCAETCACNADCASGSYCALHEDRDGMDKPGICTIGSAPGVERCR